MTIPPWARSCYRRANHALLLALVMGFVTFAHANEGNKGSVTGLPLPRFVSLKSDSVNLREGPSRDHRTTWVFQRAGLPVEIIAEFDVWRRIRDTEGTEGWVLHSLLSGRRTALISPWSKEATLPLYAKPDETSAQVAALQPLVLATIASCTGKWCRIKSVKGPSFDGFIQQTRLWGAYPDEVIKD